MSWTIQERSENDSSGHSVGFSLLSTQTQMRAVRHPSNSCLFLSFFFCKVPITWVEFGQFLYILHLPEASLANKPYFCVKEKK